MKPNYRFLFYYGFLIDNNKKNLVYITLCVDKSDLQRVYKERMLGVAKKGYIKSFKFFEDFAGNKKTNAKFLSYLRFIVYEGDLQFLGKYLNPPVSNAKTCKSAKRKLILPAISVGNETKMLERLKSIAEDCLDEYPQSYEEDIKLLQNEQLTFNQRNIIVLRMGDKKVLL